MKKCIACLKELPLDNFYFFVRQEKTYYQSRCKGCFLIETQKKKRSKIGLISKIYHSQKTRNAARGYGQMPYTQAQLLHWVLSQPNFNKIYNEWVESCYEKRKTPSIDRLDDFKPYSFDNIRLVTWDENQKKRFKDSRDGTGTAGALCKSVAQYDNYGRLIAKYQSINAASRATGIKNSSIGSVASGKRGTAGGFYWRYYEKVIANNV